MTNTEQSIQLDFGPFANSRLRRKSISLSEVQKKVLAVIDLDARASVAEIAKEIKVATHTVRSAIHRLQSLCELSPVCWIDPYRTNQVPYRMFISVHSRSSREIDKLISFLVQLPEVHWVGSLVGSYQIGLHIRAGAVHELERLLSKVDEKFGEVIVQREYSVITELTFYAVSPVTERGKKRPDISLAADNSPVKLDELDNSILHILREKPLAPISEVARSVGHPSNTIHYRINRLIEERVILGFFYSHNLRVYGLSRYFVLVSVTGLGMTLRERFRGLALSSPHIVMLTTAIGRWNIELEVIARDVVELQQIISLIHTSAEGRVRDILIHSWEKDFKG